MIKMTPLLTESYAWQRRADGSLPTLRDVQEAYKKSLKEAPRYYGDIDELYAEIAAYLADDGHAPSEEAALRALENSDEDYETLVGIYMSDHLTVDEKISMIADLIDIDPNDNDQEGVQESRAAKDDGGPDDSMRSLINIYHMYKNGEVDKQIFYSLMSSLPRHEKEELMYYINREKFTGTGLDPDGQVQEAYDAKGVEEAKDKKSKSKKGKRWQDNDGDGKWYEKGDDVSEDAKPDYIDLDGDGNTKETMKKAAADESALNMKSLDESKKFWARAKGNLHGHDYILRETFRK
jgi:hypothetical protein